MNVRTHEDSDELFHVIKGAMEMRFKGPAETVPRSAAPGGRRTL